MGNRHISVWLVNNTHSTLQLISSDVKKGNATNATSYCHVANQSTKLFDLVTTQTDENLKDYLFFGMFKYEMTKHITASNKKKYWFKIVCELHKSDPNKSGFILIPESSDFPFIYIEPEVTDIKKENYTFFLMDVTNIDNETVGPIYLPTEIEISHEEKEPKIDQHLKQYLSELKIDIKVPEEDVIKKQEQMRAQRSKSLMRRKVLEEEAEKFWLEQKELTKQLEQEQTNNKERTISVNGEPTTFQLPNGEVRTARKKEVHVIPGRDSEEERFWKEHTKNLQDSRKKEVMSNEEHKSTEKRPSPNSMLHKILQEKGIKIPVSKQTSTEIEQ